MAECIEEQELSLIEGSEIEVLKLAILTLANLGDEFWSEDEKGAHSNIDLPSERALVTLHNIQ
jgi:hypothetical protein